MLRFKIRYWVMPVLATQLIRDEPAEARDLPHRLAPGFI
jgi:hypothetical protein